MNKSFLVSLVVRIASAAILIIIVSSFCCLIAPSFALGGNVGRNFDYVFTIESRIDKRMFEYKNSEIGPPVASKVSYYRPPPSGEEMPAPRNYELFWHRGWQALGLRRLHDLDLGNNAQVAIELKNQDGIFSLAKSEASADIITRLMLDIFSRRCSVSLVIVPDEELEALAVAFNRLGLRIGVEPPPEQPVTSSLVIPIQTSSGYTRRMLFY